MINNSPGISKGKDRTNLPEVNFSSNNLSVLKLPPEFQSYHWSLEANGSFSQIIGKSSLFGFSA